MKWPCGIALFCGFLAVGQARGTTITLNPIADNSIFSENNNSSGASTSEFAGRNMAGNFRRALFEFNLSSIPAGSTISAASLTLNINQVGNGDLSAHPNSLFRLTSSWDEGTSGAGTGGGGQGSAPTIGSSTWNFSSVSQTTPTVTGTAWTTAGGDFFGTASATTSVPATVGLVTWSSTSLLVRDVQGWVETPATNFGWVLVGDEVDNGAIRRFDSREASGTGTFAPTLSVTFTAVPEPSTLAMLAMGAIPLVLGAYRRKIV